MIFWANKDERPTEASISISLNEVLTPRKKVSKWQKLSLVFTVIGSILTASIPAVLNNYKDLMSPDATTEVVKEQSQSSFKKMNQDKLYESTGLKARFSKKDTGYDDYIPEAELIKIIGDDFGVDQDGEASFFYVNFSFSPSQMEENNGFKVEFEESFIKALGGKIRVVNWQKVNPDNKNEWTVKNFVNPLTFKKENIK